MEIRKNGKPLDLGPGFSIQIDDTNPIFNELGSQSVPATIPVTRHNIELMSGIHRTDAGVNPNLPEESVDVLDGAYIRRGTLNVTEAGRKEGITFNIGFDNSTAYQKWQLKKLTELGNMPIRKPAREDDILLTDMTMIYQGYDRDLYEGYPMWWDELAVFPIAVDKEEKDGYLYWELLNAPTESRNLWVSGKVYRTIDGERMEVSVPDQYGITPFLRVWKLIELVFEDLDFKIIENPFEKDPELRRLVVLNNTADAICRNELNYRDLMPDCSVQGFLRSLWVRFGLVYNINFDSRTVELKLIKDIINGETGTILDSLITDNEFIRYNNPQYIKLSAGTSIEDAAPATERFEDFIGGCDISNIKVGSHVEDWETNDDGKTWNRELYDGYLEDRDSPEWEDRDDDRDKDYDWDYDWDDDRNDDRDDDRDYYNTRSGGPIPIAENVNDLPKAIFAKETVTGNWFKLDSKNGRTKESSSSFFDWDPQPEGFESFELSSDDECVAVGQVQKDRDYPEDLFFRGYVPLFLVGSRHFHSYIIDSDGEEREDEKKEETPLSYMISYTSGHSSVGRLTPERENGRRIILDDGSEPEMTLYFQFADGLFSRYWREFDEILRHGNRQIEVPVRFPKTFLNKMDILQPVTINGLRCLIDLLSYNLPSGKNVDVDMTLQAIQTQGEYDIEKEQNIPGLKMGGY